LICRPQIDTHDMPLVLPPDCTLQRTPLGERWWDVWRSPAYRMETLSVLPLTIQAAPNTIHDNNIDLSLWRDGQMVAALRLHLQAPIAHMVALAAQRDQDTHAYIRALQLVAAEAAAAAACDLVFGAAPRTEVAADTESITEGYRQLGSVICYQAKSESIPERAYDIGMAQYLLGLR
jgi:hypothetical protein